MFRAHCVEAPPAAGARSRFLCGPNGRLRSTDPEASAPNGGNPAKSPGLTTEAMVPGVAAVPEA